MKFFLILSVLVLTSCKSAHYANNTTAPSAEEEDFIYFLADELSKCAGKYEAMGYISELLEIQNTSRQLNDIARGYSVVAAKQLFSYNVVPKWKNARKYVDTNVAGEKQAVLSMFETDDSKGKKDTWKKLNKGIEECDSDYGELQKAEVEHIKRFISKLD